MRIKRILAGMLAAVTIIAGSIPASGVQAEAATNWSVYSDDYFYNKMNASEKKLYSGMTSAANKAMKSSDTVKKDTSSYKVTVSPKSVTLKKGARKGISYSTHSPSALTKVTWSSCNKKVAAVSGMVIRAKKKGRTTIKGTFRFADGTTKTVKISVRVK